MDGTIIQISALEMTHNPYTAPSATLINIPQRSHPGDPDGISLSEFEAFAIGNGYPEKFKRYHDGLAKTAGFNIWPALFGVQWFLIRKLYAAAVVAFFLDLSIPFICFQIARLATSSSGRIAVIVWVVLVALSRVGVGYLGNMVLFAKATKAIREVDKLNLDNERHLKQIKFAGGVNGTAPLCQDRCRVI